MAKIGEYFYFQNGYAFKSESFVENGNYKVIKIKELKDGKVKFFNDSASVIENDDDLEKYTVKNGDVLFALTGDPVSKSNPFSWVGRVSLVDFDIPAVINQRVCKAVPKGGMLSRYLYYFFRQDNIFFSLAAKATGSASQANISTKTIEETEIDVPSIETQRKVVDFLSAIDRRIVVNEQINKNLEEQIKILCKAWLVDFIPFDRIQPEAWSTRHFSDIAEFIGGYSYKGNELVPSSQAMATIKNFDRNGGFKLDGYKEIIPSSKLKDVQHVELYDTLVAHTDLTQNAEVIGNAEPVLSLSGYDDIVFSMDLVKVLPKNGISKFLIAALLQDGRFKAHALGYVNGTTVLHLSKKALPDYELLLPDDLSVLSPLTEAIERLYRMIATNIDEMSRLSQLRDELLPRLMSGEIDVSEVEI